MSAREAREASPKRRAGPPRGDGRGTRGLALLALLALALPGAARADESEGPALHLFGEAGARVLSGVPYLSLRPGLVFEAPRLRLVLAVPLEVDLRAGVETSRLRAEDFDEASDYGRLLAAFEARGETWSVRAGDLSYERLGHGTVVSDFVSTVDPDHPHAGLVATWRGAFGAELLLGDVILPSLLAGRVSRRIGDRVELGATGAADLLAPVALEGGATSTRLPAARTAAFAVAGADASVLVVRADGLSIAPYLDAVTTAAGPHAGRGALHLGVLADLDAGPELSLAVKAEARRLGAGYVPEPFDAYYEVERWRFPLGGGVPKAAADLPPAWGGRLEVLARVASAFTVGVSGDGRDLGPANAALTLGFAGERLAAGLEVAHRGFEGLRGAFSDRGWIASGEVRWDLAARVWIVARGGRIRRVDPETGAYAPAWDLGAAVGAAF